MGSWFSSEPEVQAKEAITQTGNAAVQFNWAIFSTGISSLAIILVLIILLLLCYRKNQRSNRRARRAELHDIVHSLHRSTEPSRMGYPQYPPSVANYVPPPPAATAIPMVAYPTAPPTASAPRITYTSAAGIRADAPGMPGVNSGLRRQASLRAPNRQVAPDAPAPKPLPGSPIFPSGLRLSSIREGPSASIARPRPRATAAKRATRATAAPRATEAPKALTYEPPAEQSKSLYLLFPGHFPADNAFPSLARPNVGDTFASDRFTEL